MANRAHRAIKRAMVWHMYDSARRASEKEADARCATRIDGEDVIFMNKLTPVQQAFVAASLTDPRSRTPPLDTHIECNYHVVPFGADSERARMDPFSSFPLISLPQRKSEPPATAATLRMQASPIFLVDLSSEST